MPTVEKVRCANFLVSATAYLPKVYLLIAPAGAGPPVLSTTMNKPYTIPRAQGKRSTSDRLPPSKKPAHEAPEEMHKVNDAMLHFCQHTTTIWVDTPVECGASRASRCLVALSFSR